MNLLSIALREVRRALLAADQAASSFCVALLVRLTKISGAGKWCAESDSLPAFQLRAKNERQCGRDVHTDRVGP